MIEWTPIVVTRMAAATLLLLLSVLLMSRRSSRTPATKAMTVFALGLTAFYGCVLVADAIESPAWALAWGAAYLVLTAGIVLLALRVPRPVSFRDGPLRRWALASLLGGLVLAVVGRIDFDWSAFVGDYVQGWPRTLVILSYTIGNVGWFGGLVFLAARGVRLGEDVTEARSPAILAVGLTLLGAGSAVAWTTQASDAISAATLLVSVVATSLAWFRFGSSPLARFGRRVALVLLAIWAVASLSESWLGESGSGYTFGRVLGAALLVYAVVRGQIPGIDAKVRFTVSKSVVAALFVGVFFAASEVAQQFFGQRTGNEYYGIAAAGLLVIAIAPIQRLADRLATKAVPSARIDETSAHQLYRKQASLVWADGAITRKERRLLQQLRDHLNLPAPDAERIEDEEGAPA